MIGIKGINTAGQSPAPAAYGGFPQQSCGVLNPIFPHSLDHVRASASAFSLISSIIGAMKEEVTMLKDLLKNMAVEKAGGFELCRGILDGKNTVLLQCGIGKVNAAVGCALLINKYSPELVINTGSAGGMGAGLNIGDAIISSRLIHHDADVTVFNYEPGQLPGMPAIFPVPEKLIGLAEQAVDALKGEGILPASFNYARGLIGSGDVFMNKPERAAAVAKQFPCMKAVEMEGAAIAQCCWLFKIPCLVIRALSDIAGAESNISFDEFLPVAAKHSAEIVRRIIKLYEFTVPQKAA